MAHELVLRLLTHGAITGRLIAEPSWKIWGLRLLPVLSIYMLQEAHTQASVKSERISLYHIYGVLHLDFLLKVR